MARVLLIEANGSERLDLSATLSAAGHSVTCAHSGREGMQFERRSEFQLVLIDLALADVNGLAVLDGMRGQSSAAKALLMAEDPDSLVLPLSLLERLDCGVLWKPFSSTDLLRVIHDCLTEN